MANRFVLNERSYHGKGAIQEIAGEVTSRGLKKALVCSDPDLLKFGVTKKVTDVLDEAGIAYDIYSEIKPNPTIKNVQDGVEAYKTSCADCIVTIGGGSSMDTAKGIGIIVAKPEFADVGSLAGVALSIPSMASAANAALEPYVSSAVAVLAFVLAVTNILDPFLVKAELRRHPADGSRPERPAAPSRKSVA